VLIPAILFKKREFPKQKNGEKQVNSFHDRELRKSNLRTRAHRRAPARSRAHRMAPARTGAHKITGLTGLNQTTGYCIFFPALSDDTIKVVLVN